MAGTVTQSYKTLGGCQVIKFAWLGSGTGEADATTTQKFTGRVIGYLEVPSTVAPPSNGYDVRVLDSDGADVLNGNGANITVPGITRKAMEDKLGAVVETTLTLEVRNSGNKRRGETRLMIE